MCTVANQKTSVSLICEAVLFSHFSDFFLYSTSLCFLSSARFLYGSHPYWRFFFSFFHQKDFATFHELSFWSLSLFFWSYRFHQIGLIISPVLVHLLFPSSIHPLVCPSVRLSVCPLVKNISRNWLTSFTWFFARS